MYEKDKDEFFEEVGTGRSAPGFAEFVRARLIETNADYEKILKYSGITTAKGRQQKKELLRRKIDLIMKKNKEDGVYVPRKLIEK